MAVFYNEGEKKVRPGLYQRHSNIGFSDLALARDGYCAIPVRATWGPLGTVVRNTQKNQLKKNYGPGTYGTNYTIPAAEEMFNGGASVVYTYRMGSGGAKSSKDVSGITVTSKHVGTMPLSVAVLAKISDTSMKQFQVYTDKTLLEIFEFEADGANEGANLMDAAKKSKYVDLTAETAPTTVDILPVASGGLEGGLDPTITNEDYSKAFAALESYFFNTIALDVDDDEDMSLTLMLQAYLEEAYKMGKLSIIVTGEKTTVDYETRQQHARAFNDAKVVYLGGGWMEGAKSMDGVMAICRTAGVIAATPSNQGIVHSVISGATELCETRTFTEYEDAIRSGMLMVSMSPDGEIWYDAGINTLIEPEAEIQDDGWKKIRRVKVRFEIIDRLDRELLPKVGRVSADSDGVADVVQAGQRVLDAMANDEGKLFRGPVFAEDPENPFEGDSAWFIIQADDIDSLEKIYLHFQFRYSQYV